MFSISAGEVGVIILAALILLGPRQALPLLRQLGTWVRHIRTFSTRLVGEIDQLGEANTLEHLDKTLREDAETGKGAARVDALIAELKPSQKLEEPR